MSGYAVLGLRAFLASVFVVAVFGKVRSHTALRSFAASLATAERHLRADRRLLAAAALSAEVAIIVLLSVGRTVPGFALSAAVLGGFTALTAVGVLGDEGCNCFGARAGRSRALHLGTNVILIAVSVAGLVLGAASGPGHVLPAGRILIVGSACVAAFVLTHVEDLLGPSRTTTRSGGS